MSDYTMKKAKEAWLKRIMASKMNHGTKTFAWCVFDHMYGDKTVSNPGGALIKKETNISPNKQGGHRQTLMESGAMTCRLVKNEHGDWDSYEYSLNLDWDGSTGPVSQGSTPEGNTLPPTGEHGTPQKGTQVPPTGESNLSIESIKESTKETINNNAPVVADAPTVTSSSNYEVREDDGLLGFSCLLPNYQVENLEGITYFLNSWGVERVEEADASLNHRTLDGFEEDDFWSEKAVAERINSIGSKGSVRQSILEEAW